MRKMVLFLAVLAVCISFLLGFVQLGQAGPPMPEVPVKGLVTMVDLGARSCIPCKMMEPILEKLQREYRGRAAIVFIDISIHREAVKRFGIRAIPTQIFFDKEGKEVYRHLGFMSERHIAAQLRKMGVE
ncbi:MAG: thioredoxin family protein [Thermodesulfobacteriota bacterium]